MVWFAFSDNRLYNTNNLHSQLVVAFFVTIRGIA